MPNTKKSKYSEARPITTPTAISPGATWEWPGAGLSWSASWRAVSGDPCWSKVLDMAMLELENWGGSRKDRTGGV
ncbi:hypothetical protein GCM10009429_12610 [Dyella marensis]